MRVSIPQLKLNDGERFWGRVQHSADYFGFAEKDTKHNIPPSPNLYITTTITSDRLSNPSYELDIIIIINTEPRRPQST